jgi:hypothetical protein
MRVIHAEPGIFTDVDVLLPLLSSGDEGDIGVCQIYQIPVIEDFPNFNFGAISSSILTS